MDNNVVQVKVSSPIKDYYAGPATSISSVNSKGKFDILAYHANFLTFVKNQPIVIRIPQKKPLTFHFPFAIIYNSNNSVHIFTDIQIQLG